MSTTTTPAAVDPGARKSPRRPGVVFHLLIGIVVGPSLLGLVNADDPSYGPGLRLVAEVGIVLLIFSVGLGTRFTDLKRVGRSAFITATVGVVTPLAAGTALMVALGFDWRAALFVGAAMVATSVGITAVVLGDLGILSSVPARIILGAAVIDDVMGMLVLAVVGSVAGAGQASALQIGVTLAVAVAFVMLLLPFGARVVERLSPELSAGAPARRSRKALLVALSVCLVLSLAAGAIGLAPIIGAFLAGVAFADRDAAYRLREQVEPAKRALAPVFFGLMGVQVSLAAVLAAPGLLGLALGLTGLAAVSKYVPCRLAARREGLTGARVVGAGMIPRGEVGLIVASTGLAAGVLTVELFSVVVFMSIGTTLMGPPALRLALRPPGGREGVPLKVARAPAAAAQTGAARRP